MKNIIIKTVSLLIVFCTIVGLCSCKLTHKQIDGIMTTNRPHTLPSSNNNSVKVTDQSVIAIAPEGDEAIIKYFNDALSNFYENDFEFIRKKSVTLRSYSAGSLSSVSGSTESYRSALQSACSDMMGVGSLETQYYIGDDISSAFAINEVSEELLKGCSASAEENKVKLSFEYKTHVGESDNTLDKLTRDYMTAGAFSQKIRSYGASYSSAEADLSSIKLSAVIDYSTKNFISIKIEFNTSFKSDSISFDYVSGGPLSGTTKTVISYGSFNEK